MNIKHIFFVMEIVNSALMSVHYQVPEQLPVIAGIWLYIIKTEQARTQFKMLH